MVDKQNEWNKCLQNSLMHNLLNGRTMDEFIGVKYDDFFFFFAITLGFVVFVRFQTFSANFGNGYDVLIFLFVCCRQFD